ncbi:arginine deiminase-related protein, partial [Gammaproteobacteria bacterium]|nr:arginine deiminase-related protein [Gammaproteobacteria bacterium]
MNQQTSKYLMLIRPRSFSSNEETLVSNDFQNQFEDTSSLASIRAEVDLEFTNMISVLSDHKIDHVVFEDIEGLGSPDAIFPNNWVTFHDDGTVVLYPMM